MRHKQSGITLIGFLIVIAIVAFFAYAAMKLVPSYIEFMGVSKAVNQAASEGADGKTLDDIRRALAVKFDFQYVDDAAVKPRDITIVRGPSGAQLNVSYEKRIPFIYNIDLLLHFDKSAQLQGNLSQ